MDIVQFLLNIMLHFTPLGCLLCVALLFMRRKDGDRSRIMLSVSLAVCGMLMLEGLMSYCGAVREVLSMVNLNVALFMFFAMLLYPLEVVEPGRVSLKSVLMLFMSCIFLNVVLLLTQPDFRHFTSFGEILPYINEYNVVIRIIVLLYFLPISFAAVYIPYRYTRSRVDMNWINWFCVGIIGGALLCLSWILTGSDVLRLILQVYCLGYCLIITYRELYLRLPSLSIKKELRLESNLLEELEFASASPLWKKLTKLMREQAVWRNPELTLVELAFLMGTNRTTLSNLIREAGYDGFYSFVNTCRIKAFIHIINHEQVQSIHEALFDVGFRSKSTANRYFRQETGTTPSEYLQQILDSRK